MVGDAVVVRLGPVHHIVAAISASTATQPIVVHLIHRSGTASHR